MPFDDLIAANRTYADDFHHGGFDGIAKAGVAMVTCMDSRIDPLKMIGLEPGDAKILRNPGGRVTDQVLVVQHTRCAMASAPEEELQARVGTATGTDASWMTLGAITDQEATIRADVHKIESHPLVPDDIEVGGFVYDVDSGLLKPVV